LGLWQFHNTEFNSHFDLVPGGRGDPRMITAALEYVHQALNGLGQIASPAFYYPASHTLGYADTFFTYQVLYHLFRQGNWDIFSSFQMCVLISDLLNYVFCFLLLNRGFRFGVTASAIGAFFFDYNCPKFNQIGHAQLQCLFWLPLLVWCGVVFLRDQKNLTQFKAFLLLSAAAIGLNLQLLTAFYPSWFFLFWTFLFSILLIVNSETRSYFFKLFWKFKLSIRGALLVFLVGFVPFLWLYLPVILKLGGKGYEEVKMMIPGISSFLWMGPRHGWWGWIWNNCQTIRELPVEGEERMGLGLAVEGAWIALSLAALSWIFRGKNPKSFWFQWLIPNDKQKIFFNFFIGAILSTDLFILLGLKFGDFSLWHLVYWLVPGANAIRAVSRYILFLAFPLGVVLSYACERLFKKIGEIKDGFNRWGSILLAASWIVVAVWEQVNLPPYPAFSKSMELQRLEYLSEKLPVSCRLFYVMANPQLPLVPDYSATDLQIDAMLLSAVRGIPTLNGYSGHSPENWGLYKVRSPRYGQYVSDWMTLNDLKEPACQLDIDR
jgi:hypothetical protein